MTSVVALIVALSCAVAYALGASAAAVAVTFLVVSVQAAAGLVVVRRLTTGPGDVGLGALAISLGIGLATLSDITLNATPVAQIAWAIPSVLALPFVPWRRTLTGGLTGLNEAAIAAMAPIVIAALLSMAYDYYWTVIPAIALTAVTFAGRRWPSNHRQTSPHGSQFGLAMTGAAVLLTVFASRWSGPHEPWLLQRKDFVFFRSLAWSLDRYGPGENPLLADTPLHYHWLSYAWLGSLDRLTPGGPWETLTIVGPAIACVLLIATAWGWVRARAGAGTAVLAVAVLALADTPRLWSAGIHAARLESFSAVFGAVFLLCIPLALARVDSPRALAILALPCGLLALMSKLSHGVIAAAGLVAVVLLDVRRRRRALVSVGALGLTFSATAIVVFGIGISERGDSLALGPLSFPWLARPELLALAAWAYVPIATALIAAFLVIPAVVIVGIARRWRTATRDDVFVSVAAAAGVAIFVLCARVEASQGFFLHSALVVATPLCALQATERDRSHATHRWSPVAIAAGLGAAVAMTATHDDSGTGGRLQIILRALPMLAPLGAVLLSAILLGAGRAWRAPGPRQLCASAALVASVGTGIGNWTIDVPEYLRERAALASESPGGPAVDALRAATDRLTSTDEILATSHSLCDGMRCSGAAWEASVTSDCELTPKAIGSGSCFLSYAPPLAGLLERRFWINGFSFLSPGAPTATDLRRARASLALAQRPGATTVGPLREAGVKWFIVDKDLPHADDYGAVSTVRYENARFIVLELHDA